MFQGRSLALMVAVVGIGLPGLVFAGQTVEIAQSAEIVLVTEPETQTRHQPEQALIASGEPVLGTVMSCEQYYSETLFRRFRSCEVSIPGTDGLHTIDGPVSPTTSGTTSPLASCLRIQPGDKIVVLDPSLVGSNAIDFAPSRILVGDETVDAIVRLACGEPITVDFDANVWRLADPNAYMPVGRKYDDLARDALGLSLGESSPDFHETRRQLYEQDVAAARAQAQASQTSWSDLMGHLESRSFEQENTP